MYGVLIVGCFLMLAGCDITKSLQSIYNMKNCDYQYKSITNLKVSNMNISNGISVLQIPQLLTLLSGSASSIPLAFTLNLDVHNPNATQAAFQSLQYIIHIDDVEFTTGRLNQPFSVDAGATQPLPIQIGVDIVTLISNNSQSAILNIVKNFIGIGNDKSNVTVNLKPTFNVGNSMITSPVFIPVSFTFGGK
jgi:LEA14-like dessication related protein